MAVGSRRTEQLFVVAVPHVLEFCTEEQVNDAKCFTLMNCYEFPVKFKIVWRTKNKYNVTPTEFVMQPTKMGQCYVRYVPGAAPPIYDVHDYIDILMYDCPTNKILGKGSVQITLLPRKVSVPDNTAVENKHVNRVPSEESTRLFRKQQMRGPTILGAILLMILILYLPAEGDNVDTFVPSFLHVSHTCKLFISFLVGYLCCFLFTQHNHGFV